MPSASFLTAVTGCRAGIAVVDDDGLPFGEFQRIADDGSVLGERFDRGDVIAVVECRDDGLHRPEIGVHVVAEPFEFTTAARSRPCV